jgi:DNA-directed RNA polymerase subunit M/transcription elongation factor TFIIS
MRFCKCGRIIIENRDSGRIRCDCGEEHEFKESDFEEDIIQKEKVSSEVIDVEKDNSGFPHLCKRCGHGFAEVRDLGVFYSDEASVHIFTCKRCGNSTRESGGTGSR